MADTKISNLPAVVVVAGTESIPLVQTSTTKRATVDQLKTYMGVSGVNTGDQDLSGLVTKTTTVNGHALSSNVTVTSSDVGLGNVDNTSDLNKPISTATSTALSGKQATLVSGTNIKTINGTSVLGSGDITITGSSDGVGFRDRLVNSWNQIDQGNEGAAQTYTAGAAYVYNIDQWYGYCTGANVTGQRVAGTAPNQYLYQYTGASSVTKIGHLQRIEASGIQDLAGTTVALSVELANSLLTTVTWTAWYANSVNTFGTLSSPTRTQIATGTFTVNSTLTRYTTTISLPSNAANGVEIEYSVGAQTSGTFKIGRSQLEPGSSFTSFEFLPFSVELLRCMRYYEKSYNIGIVPGSSSALGTEFFYGSSDGGSTGLWGVRFKVNKFASPTVNTWAEDGTANQWYYTRNGVGATLASTTVDRIAWGGCRVFLTVGAAWANCSVTGHWVASSRIP